MTTANGALAPPDTKDTAIAIATATATASDDTFKTIVEGSAQMCYPADEDSTVFYNPVQVQNRDLSVLMITLAAERRAIRTATKQRKKDLRGTVTAKDQLAAYAQELQANPAKALTDSATAAPGGGITILDALAASGLRSMRYWNEIPGVQHVMINDLDAAAVERAHTNLRVNNLQDVLVTPASIAAAETGAPRAPGIRIHHGDATHVMYNSRKAQGAPPPADPSLAGPPDPAWDVIDLDPYGSAAPFLDGAVQAIADGGLLCITCTDMAALGGSHPETCFGRYASMPIPRAGYLQELALRILLQSTAAAAARHGRYIRPVLSVGMNFYIRIFVEVYNDKAAVQKYSLNVGNVYQSTQCSSFHICPAGQMGGKKGNVYQPGRSPVSIACEETKSSFKIGGPLWLGPMHDVDVVKEALKRLESKDETVTPPMKWIATKERLRGLLMSCRDELPDVPLFYKLPDMAQTLHVSTPPLVEFKAALVNAGYRVSGYHKEPQAIKTDAPNSIVWDIMRAWSKKDPPINPSPPGSAAEKILAVEASIQVDFSVPKSMKLAREGGVPRFPQNPQPNWGPKSKASGHKRKAEDETKTS